MDNAVRRVNSVDSNYTAWRLYTILYYSVVILVVSTIRELIKDVK